MKQSPGEKAWILGYGLLLPGSQLDVSEVLSPGAMLWEQARPMFGGALYFRTADPLDTEHSRCRHHVGHRDLGGLDEAGPIVGAHNVQRVDVSPASGDVPVAEVKPKEIGICPLV
jgi:hypothetical protein